jgi:hypothetical protein
VGEADVRGVHAADVRRHAQDGRTSPPTQFFTYLGQDFEGRVVVLNRAAHLLVDQIKDVE